MRSQMTQEFEIPEMIDWDFTIEITLEDLFCGLFLGHIDEVLKNG